MTTSEPPVRRLIGVNEVARMLACSWRTVLRLADAGKIPWGVKVGSLRRWDIKQIEDFIADGCKMHPAGTGARRPHQRRRVGSVSLA
jgi:excisionase family DNA binding protein